MEVLIVGISIIYRKITLGDKISEFNRRFCDTTLVLWGGKFYKNMLCCGRTKCDKAALNFNRQCFVER